MVATPAFLADLSPDAEIFLAVSTCLRCWETAADTDTSWLVKASLAGSSELWASWTAAVAEASDRGATLVTSSVPAIVQLIADEADISLSQAGAYFGRMFVDVLSTPSFLALWNALPKDIQTVWARQWARLVARAWLADWYPDVDFSAERRAGRDYFLSLLRRRKAGLPVEKRAAMAAALLAGGQSLALLRPMAEEIDGLMVVRPARGAYLKAAARKDEEESPLSFDAPTEEARLPNRRAYRAVCEEPAMIVSGREVFLERLTDFMGAVSANILPANVGANLVEVAARIMTRYWFDGELPSAASLSYDSGWPEALTFDDVETAALPVVPIAEEECKPILSMLGAQRDLRATGGLKDDERLASDDLKQPAPKPVADGQAASITSVASAQPATGRPRRGSPFAPRPMSIPPVASQVRAAE